MTSDPVGLAIAEALARRAAAQQGPAREVMLRRLEQRLAALAPAAAAKTAPPAAPSALADLSVLVDRLGRAPRPLKALAAYRPTWSRLRAEQRLRLALAEVPANAGPLNSQHLVHQALQALHTLSPAYLDAFLSHVDTLLALDQTAAIPAPVPSRAEPATRPGKPAKPSRTAKRPAR